MRKLLLALAFAMPAPVTATTSSDLSRENLTHLDTALRELAIGCKGFGFEVVASPDPKVMFDKISARLLLQDRSAATMTANRWASYAGALHGISDPKVTKDAAEKAGAYLTAATIDPSTHDEAKQKYIEVISNVMRPLISACTEAAGDPMLSAHYVAGTGSLAHLEAEWGRQFEASVREVKASR